MSANTTNTASASERYDAEKIDAIKDQISPKQIKERIRA